MAYISTPFVAMRKAMVWRERLQKQLDSRVLIAFHSGMALVVILMLMCLNLPINFMASWYERPNSSSTGWPRLHSLSAYNPTGEQELGARSETVVYLREWESPEVREATEKDKVGEESYGEEPRRFVPLGIGSFLFSLFGSYRTGPKSFAVVGLGPKVLHRHWSRPGFHCSWVVPPPSDNSSEHGHAPDVKLTNGEIVIEGTATSYYLPDKDFQTEDEYATLVVHCTFDGPVGVDGKGGELKMTANDGKETGLQSVDFVAMNEQAGQYNDSKFEAPFKYEYLYCGSPMYGFVNPHRLREWVAYHMRLFGQNSHFIFYDAGGLSDEEWIILEPWVKLGRLSIMNVRQQARYRAYLFNQFLFANDCMFRAKTLAKWTFFFDVDEYLHLSQSAHLDLSFHEVMAELATRGRRATSIQLQQRPMSNLHCVRNDSMNPTSQHSQWAIEKLIYRRQVNHSEAWTHWRDYKSAIQAKHVLAMGVHSAVAVEVPPDLSEDEMLTRLDLQADWCGDKCVADKLHYYHYRGTFTSNEELCHEFVDPLNATFHFDGATYEFDNSMTFLADIAKDFEFRTIGNVTFNES